MALPSARYQLPPRFTEWRPEQADPQALFITRLLEKMPKDRVKNTMLPWPRTRKKATDFLDLYDKTYSTWPVSTPPTQGHQESSPKPTQPANLPTYNDGYETTSTDDIDMHDVLMPESQPGSESEVSPASTELSNDLCNAMEVDDGYMYQEMMMDTDNRKFSTGGWAPVAREG